MEKFLKFSDFALFCVFKCMKSDTRKKMLNLFVNDLACKVDFDEGGKNVVLTPEEKITKNCQDLPSENLMATETIMKQLYPRVFKLYVKEMKS